MAAVPRPCAPWLPEVDGEIVIMNGQRCATLAVFLKIIADGSELQAICVIEGVVLASVHCVARTKLSFTNLLKSLHVTDNNTTATPMFCMLNIREITCLEDNEFEHPAHMQRILYAACLTYCIRMWKTILSSYGKLHMMLGQEHEPMMVTPDTWENDWDLYTNTAQLIAVQIEMHTFFINVCSGTAGDWLSAIPGQNGSLCLKTLYINYQAEGPETRELISKYFTSNDAKFPGEKSPQSHFNKVKVLFTIYNGFFGSQMETSRLHDHMKFMITDVPVYEPMYDWIVQNKILWQAQTLDQIRQQLVENFYEYSSKQKKKSVAFSTRHAPTTNGNSESGASGSRHVFVQPKDLTRKQKNAYSSYLAEEIAEVHNKKKKLSQNTSYNQPYPSNHERRSYSTEQPKKWCQHCEKLGKSIAACQSHWNDDCHFKDGKGGKGFGGKGKGGKGKGGGKGAKGKGYGKGGKGGKASYSSKHGEDWADL